LHDHLNRKPLDDKTPSSITWRSASVPAAGVLSNSRRIRSEAKIGQFAPGADLGHRFVPLSEYLDQLSGFEPAGLPLISLYLNSQPDQHGRDNFEPVVRKEFAAVARTFGSRSPELLSFEGDAERIRTYLKTEVKPSSTGVAILAFAG
jgi:hypothetical protein